LVRDVIEDIAVFGTGADDETVLFIFSRCRGGCGCGLVCGSRGRRSGSRRGRRGLSGLCVFATDFTVLLSVLDLAVSTAVVYGHATGALFGGCFAASRVGTNAVRHGIKR
jgi:hypothetical protein